MSRVEFFPGCRIRIFASKGSKTKREFPFCSFFLCNLTKESKGMDLQGTPMVALVDPASANSSFRSAWRSSKPVLDKMMQRDGGVIISWANIRGGHRLAACFAFIKLALSRPLSSPPFHPLLSLQLLIKADIKGIKCGVIVGRERGHETIPRYFFPYLSSRFRGIIQTMSIIRFQRLVRPALFSSSSLVWSRIRREESWFHLDQSVARLIN